MGCGASNLKEEIPADSIVQIPNNIISSSKSLIEIENKNKIIPGFLFSIPNAYFFMTLKENITKDMIEKKEDVKLYYDNKKKFITINLNSEERIIKDFTDIGINSIVVEILFDKEKYDITDDIEEEYFLSIMKQHDELQDLTNEEIDLIYTDKDQLRYSKGKIKKIEKNKFTYSTNFNSKCPGNPIFFSNSKEVIGIQHTKNSAYFLGPIYHYLRKNRKNQKQREKNLKQKKKKKKLK